IRYDVERGALMSGDDPVRLTATESQLMRIFAACPGEPVSRTKLVEDLGRGAGKDGSTAQERAVDVQITRLRRKIEADPKQPRYLQTVRGAGYMLAPD
ncbi:MAG: winged helix-turn-helix domain-containing protein, partial [Alphaproteobacteria bacterium]|nr:winged helix-turn-helix domain-containing protein [Alphaproteobacteria bacterium]